MGDIGFANTIAELDLGATAASVMTECEKYGMCYGCDQHCPVLKAGKCENEDSIEMYKRFNRGIVMTEQEIFEKLN